ncbi:MAG: putative molybdopterin biosynthesis protein [Gammaproteobacteria bacterium]|jgi:putative molybdopterin biosynthesis protein
MARTPDYTDNPIQAPTQNGSPGTSDAPRFLSVREVADYLKLNEKKVYSLAAEGKIPGTKVTGKWLFPRDLIDQWLTRSSHGGVFTDRLVIAGADDPLIARLVSTLCAQMNARALIAYTPTGTQLGLSLLSAERCDAALVHWGPTEESQMRHPALIRGFADYTRWVLVRAFRREQGLMLAPGVSAQDANTLITSGLRIVARTPGSGTGRYFEETVAGTGTKMADLSLSGTVHTDREAAEQLRLGNADITPACRAAATESGLEFVSVGWESVDLVLPRGLYFRTLLQHLLDALRTDETFLLAERLGGYDFPDSGKLIWAAE